MEKSEVDKKFLTELSDLLTVALEKQTKFTRNDQEFKKNQDILQPLPKDEKQEKELLETVNVMVVDACNYRLKFQNTTTVKLEVSSTPTPDLAKLQSTPTPDLTKLPSTLTPDLAKLPSTPTPDLAKLPSTPTPDLAMQEKKPELPKDVPKQSSTTPITLEQGVESKSLKRKSFTVEFVHKRGLSYSLQIVPSVEGETATYMMSCKPCQKFFEDRTVYGEHLQTSHKGAVKVFECLPCNKQFSSKGHMWEHLPVHTGIKPIACDECSETFWRRQNMLDHKVAKHKKNSKRKT